MGIWDSLRRFTRPSKINSGRRYHSEDSQPAHTKKRGLRLEQFEERMLLSISPSGLDSETLWKHALSLAVEQAGNLDNYSEEALAATDSWVVGLTDSTVAKQLAAALGADQLGEAQYLDEAYIWQFSASVGWESVANMLGSVETVDYFYPLVPEQYESNFAPNDPLYPDQWHLNNTGQSGGTVGADANVELAWDLYDGSGVVIGIVDDGLQYTHPDLTGNYRADLSYDFADYDADPAPFTDAAEGYDDDSHGTSVAGVAAAQGNNSIGVSGVAPGAELAGLRLDFITGMITDAEQAAALSYANDEIDIYNNSWGPVNLFVAPGPQAMAALYNGVTNGRDGLGSIYVCSAGNSAQSYDNVNYSGFANSRFTIAVGALDHDGVHSYYSEPGASLLISAYSNGWVSGITTTDLLGTDGYNYIDDATDGDALDDLDYNSTFGGTSSAAPLVSGVIALILEANPNLTYRDVQHILVESAAMTDATNSDWVINGGGYHVNHEYGFGAIDAAAAVELAANWENVAEEQWMTSGRMTVNQAIPDSSVSSVSSTVTMDSDIGSIEWVEVVFDADHTYSGDLEIILTSPSGTESVLATVNPSTTQYDNWTFTSARHWGETSAGDWTLTVRDAMSGDTGTFEAWELNIYGTQAGVAPELVAVLPNSGELILGGEVLEIAPRELTLRFSEGQVIDVNSLQWTDTDGQTQSPIQIVRAGDDGQFGTADDVEVEFGWIGRGDEDGGRENEIIVRFAETLPDDLYQLRIVGSGDHPLRNNYGIPFRDGGDFTTEFELDLGAQVTAVVPQPITRDASGNLSQACNQIDVYFNNDDLNYASVTNPEFYTLLYTNDTATEVDDTVAPVHPTTVTYDATADKVVLTFAQDLADYGTGAVRLRIGTEYKEIDTKWHNLSDDPADTFTDAEDLGNLGTVTAETLIIAAEIEPVVEYALTWPGALDEPGHRELPGPYGLMDVDIEDHLLSHFGADVVAGIPTFAYNFNENYGALPGSGIPSNLITEAQKDLVRQIFDLYGYYLGVQFVETDAAGINIAVGDLRAQGYESGPGGVAGLGAYGMFALMDAAEDWESTFGGNFFFVAMHEIGHALGLGHTYDLPAGTVMGNESFYGGTEYYDQLFEAIWPAAADIIHGQYTYRPDSNDIDLYKFVPDKTGRFSAETIAERLDSSSSLDTVITLFDGATGEVIARNDDYFSEDSYLEFELEAGKTYFIGVSASGNDDYDPNIEDSGIGGTTQGEYELRLTFVPDADAGQLVDATDTPLDGDADGIAGGEYNFWFDVQKTDDTLYVDKAATGGTGALGSIDNPYTTIDDALAAAGDGDIVRIVGNGGADGRLSTTDDNLAYEIGVGKLGRVLEDGETMEIPQGVTVMIDAGALFKLRDANIDVGSSADGIDRSGGALQVLGTPEYSVIFTSHYDESLGVDSEPLATNPFAGDWGGLVFRNDLDYDDLDEGRTVLESEGIFLNYVNHADIRYGGGTVTVNSESSPYYPIHMIEARPTVTYNTITNSAHAALSADPNSFMESKYYGDTYTLDYDRVGPDMYGNRLIDNSINGIYIRIQTDSGSPIDELEVAGRFDDLDMVHVVLEDLIISGTPGGAIVDAGQVPLSFAGFVIDDLAAVVDGYTFSVTDGTHEVIFEFEDTAIGDGVPSGHVAVAFTAGDSENTIANAIKAAIEGQSLLGVEVEITLDNQIILDGPVGTDLTPLTTPLGSLGDVAFEVLDSSYVMDGYQFEISDGSTTLTFEFENTAVGDGVDGIFTIPVPYTPGTDTPATIAETIVNLINYANTQGFEVVAMLADNQVWLAGATTTATPSYQFANVLSPFMTGTVLQATSTRSDVDWSLDLVDGQTFEIFDGTQRVVFEFDDLTEGDGVEAGHFAVGYQPGNLPSDIAAAVADAINEANTSSPYINVTATAKGKLVSLYSSADISIDLSTSPDARLDGRLRIDEGMIIKLDGTRIETEIGSQLIAEGTDELPIVFTSLSDDRYGAGGTFDTINDNEDLNPSTPTPGDWGGLFFGVTSSGSVDYARIYFGGGETRVEGGYGQFNPIEIHQAEVRVTNTFFNQNLAGASGGVSGSGLEDMFEELGTEADPDNGALLQGVAASTIPDRVGRGTTEPATIFVRGAQPVIAGNVFVSNAGSSISIDANSMTADYQVDWGRSTGAVDTFDEYNDNYGPLVRDNRLADNQTNGMEIRGAVLTVESIWDDTDIVHVLRSEITVPNYHHEGGLLLQSSDEGSLVVKLDGEDAGFTAAGKPQEIDDRIGGTVQIIGTPNNPVILTALADDTVGAGFDPWDQPQYNTDNVKASPTEGAWRSIKLEEYSNDRNVAVINELEDAYAAEDENGLNAQGKPATAEYLGELAPDIEGGDDNLRLGFEVNGFINFNDATDQDVYYFQAEAGTEIWIDIDETRHSLDTIVELIDANGNVLASSDNSYDDTEEAGGSGDLTGDAMAMDRDIWDDDPNTVLQRDFYTTNQRDAGFRVVLPGAVGETRLYYIKVSSKEVTNGVANDASLDGTTGGYQLQVRLKEEQEVAGSTIRYADIRYATNGIEVNGLPTSSPLLVETSDVDQTGGSNDTSSTAQDIGNLLESNNNAIEVAGYLGSASDVDWYSFDVDYTGMLVSGSVFPTVFDIDYADGMSRPNATIWVFDSTGRLVLVSQDSNIVDDQRGEEQGSSVDDLSRGSFGFLDPYIGTQYLPEGDNVTYYVAVTGPGMTANAVLDQPLLRLEPIDSVARVVEDHIGADDGDSLVADDSQTLNLTPVEFHLGDVVMYINTGDDLYTADPFTGTIETDVTGTAYLTDTHSWPFLDYNDIAMRNDGRLYTFTGRGSGANVDQNATAGQYLWLDTGDATNVLSTQDDGIVTYQQDPENPDSLIVRNLGIEFEAIEHSDATGDSRYVYAVGNASPGGLGVEYTDNLLYVFDSDGTPIDHPSPLADGSPRVTTNIVPHGVLNTGSGITPPAATDTTYSYTDPGDILDATTFTVQDQDGNQYVFEFDCGPDIRLDPDGPAVVRDGQTFRLVGGSYDVTFEFDSGPVLLVGAGGTIQDGETFSIRAAGQTTPVVFEFDNNNVVQLDANLTPLNEVIAFSSTQTVDQVLSTIITVISAQQDLTADGYIDANGQARISLDGDATIDVAPNLESLDVEGAYGLIDSDHVVISFEETMSEEAFDQAIVAAVNAAMPSVDASYAHLPDNSGLGDRITFYGATLFDATEVNSTATLTWMAPSAATTPTIGNGVNLSLTAADDWGGASDQITFAVEYQDYSSLANPNRAVAGFDPVLNQVVLRFDPFNTTMRTLARAINDEGHFNITLDASMNNELAQFVQFGGDLAEGDLVTPASLEIDFAGANNEFVIEAAAAGTDLNDVHVVFRVADYTGDIAEAVYDDTDPLNKQLTITYDPFETTANTIVAAVSAVPEFYAYPTGDPANNDGTGLLDVAELATSGVDRPDLTASGAQTLDETPGFGVPSWTHALDNTGNHFSTTGYNGDYQIIFGAGDSADDIQQAIIDAIRDANITSSNGSVLTGRIQGDDVMIDNGSVVTADNPLDLAGSGGPGGAITGLAFIDGHLYAVSDGGGLYEVMNYNSWGFHPVNPEEGYNYIAENAGGPYLQYIGTVASAATAGGNARLSGLAPGPSNVEEGVYHNMLFATDYDGFLYALDSTTGTLQPVFVDGATSVDLGITDVRGVDFSPIDYNLWHQTDRRQGDDGHGIDTTFDDTRTTSVDYPVAGGTSYWFGLQDPRPAGEVVEEQPGAENWIDENEDYLDTYDVPGGAYGSLITDTFSLAGYDYGDEPVLYFNYYCETENSNSWDAARVYISNDGVNWELLATNTDLDAQSVNDYLFPDSPAPQGAEIIDEGVYWRQARVELNDYAGLDNLQLRFDFNTASDTQTGDINLTGTFLSALSGQELVDGDSFVIDSTTFEFDMGIGLLMPNVAGLAIEDGSYFEVTDNAIPTPHTVRFEFDKDGTLDPTYTGVRVGITIEDDMLPLEVAELIEAAVNSAVTAGLLEGVSADALDSADYPASEQAQYDPFEFENRVMLHGAASVTQSPEQPFRDDSRADDPAWQAMAAERASSTGGDAEALLDEWVLGIQGNGSGTSTGVPIVITQTMTAEEVAIAIADALDSVFSATDLPGVYTSCKVEGEVVTLIGHDVGKIVDPITLEVVATLNGPLPYSDQMASNLALENPIEKEPIGDRFTSYVRGQDNHYEGFYIDDIIIGFAERGEMVTGADPDTTFVQQDFVAALENAIGNYQLEIRRGADYGLKPVPFSPPDWVGLLEAFDTNDRLNHSVTLRAPAVDEIQHGMTFILSDGVNEVKFQFIAENQLDTMQDSEIVGVPIVFGGWENPGEMGDLIAAAINGASGFDAYASSIATSERIDLFNVARYSEEIDPFILLFDQDGLGESTGDENSERDQGYLIIESNTISYSAEYGIKVDAGERDTDANWAHPSSTAALSVTNVDSLVPGIMIQNNVLNQGGSGGILFSGDTQPDGEPTAAVPFGRIVNNTIYGRGSTTTTEYGIKVEENAGPTLLNNIVCNVTVGIGVDASSLDNTVIGSTLYKDIYNNQYAVNTDTNTAIDPGEFPLMLDSDDPLFVNAAAGNFYLDADSLAIDSSVDSLQERESLAVVLDPMGLDPSPILAPERDLYGQLRVDDPDISPPVGMGTLVYKDRGAVDRVDRDGPTARLINPEDNDAAGVDRNVVTHDVSVTGQTLFEFTIELSDTGGIGVDDSTVFAQQVEVYRDDVLLVEGFDYLYQYDAVNDCIHLFPAAGIWQEGYIYTIKLNNDPETGIRDLANNPLEANRSDGEVRFEIALAGLDFGDAPDPSYPSLSENDGARHIILGGYYLGTNASGETESRQNALASGDSFDDGVVFDAGLWTGHSSTLTVTASREGKLDAWIDFNGDGDWDDTDEKVFDSIDLVAGENTLSIDVPSTAAVGWTFGRFRFSADGGLGVTGEAINGEVEDYRIRVVDVYEDYGDAPAPFPTMFADGGASHAIGGTLYLGQGVDFEFDGQPNSAATGDDSDGNDDEDGVSFITPPVSGADAEVVVTASVAGGYLNAWVDFNLDGDWDDAGEQIFDGVALAAGENSLTFSVPATMQEGDQPYARFRVSSDQNLGYSGAAADGEVEDYRLSIVSVPEDFGDAPMPYPTTLINSGARHTIVAGFHLGASVDYEIDGQPNATATGDDVTDNDDEDGVVFSGNLIPQTEVTVTVSTVNTSADLSEGYLNAWIDFNRDGDWDDAGEHVFVDQLLDNNASTDLALNVPADVVAGETFARFRYSHTAGLSYNGPASSEDAPDGEVEDYQVTIEVGDASISGWKFNDLNGDGIWNSNAGTREPGLAGVTVFLDANANGVHDTGEPTTVTTEDDPATLNVDETGYYEFAGLFAGQYRVYEVIPETWDPSDWIQTTPTMETDSLPTGVTVGQYTDAGQDRYYYAVDLEAGTTLEDMNFGNLQQGHITVTDVAIAEGNEGTTEVTITIELTDAFYAPIEVTYATADGLGANAATVADNDYVPASGTIQFNPVGTPSPTWDVLTLTSNSTNDYDYHVSGSLVVWEEYDGADWEIYLYDHEKFLELQQEDAYTTPADATVRVTVNNGYDRHVAVAGDKVVWAGQGGTDGDYEIFLFDYGQYKVAGDSAVVNDFVDQLTNNTYDDLNPQISDLGITWWADMPTDQEIFYYDFTVAAANSAYKAVNISNNATDDFEPRISGDRVVWHGYNTTTNPKDENLEIFFYDANTGVTQQLTSNSSEDRRPRIDGDQIVWQGKVGEDWEIFRYDIAAAASNTAYQPVNISNHDGDDINPEVSGGQVVWQGYVTDYIFVGYEQSDYEIFLYDVEVADAVGSYEAVQVTDNAVTDEMPRIEGNRLVWRNYTAGDWDVMYAEIGALFGESNVSDSTAYDWPAQVSDSLIVWRSRDSEDYEIMIATQNEPVTTMTFTVLINGDFNVEDDENFLVKLTGATFAEIDSDQAVVWILNDDGQLDYGDAPASYDTLLDDNGARHVTGSGVYLGERVDAEGDGRPNLQATGDDTWTSDDEDGIVFETALVPGEIARVSVTASTGGYLNAWLDFDSDGTFADYDVLNVPESQKHREKDEQIAWSTSSDGSNAVENIWIEAGTTELYFLVPEDAVVDGSYARFRFSSEGNLTFIGNAADGEVEDYAVTISPIAQVVDNELHLVGTDGDDTFEFTAGATAADWVVKVNGVEQIFPDTVEQIFFDGREGNDQVTLIGTAGADTAVLEATAAELSGSGYAVFTTNVENPTVYGRAGEDTITFYDNAGRNQFVAGRGFAGYLTGFAGELRSYEFELVTAYATDGIDEAKLYDSAGDDVFVSDPNVSTLTGGGMTITVHDFQGVHAYATLGGVDKAYFTDTALDDQVIGTHEYAIMWSPNYEQGVFNRSKFFEESYAVSSQGGADIVKFYDGPGDDAFVADEHEASFTCVNKYTTSSVYVEDFVGVHAFASTGTGYDTATFYDSTGNDEYYSDAVQAALWNTTAGWYNRAKFFERTDAYATAGGTDKATLYDSTFDDNLLLDANSLTIYGADNGHHFGTSFRNRIELFDTVYAKSIGGTDVLELEDSNGADTLEATGHQLSFFSAEHNLDYVLEDIAQTTAKTDDNNTDTRKVLDYLFDIDFEGNWKNL